MLCVQLALLGVGSAVIALFPAHQERPARLLDTALTSSLVAGAVVGLAFAGLAAAAFAAAPGRRGRGRGTSRCSSR